MTVYNDRLEYRLTSGGTRSMAAFGAVGMAVASARAKKKDAVIFQMRDIVKVKESKFGAGYPAMVLEMRDGHSHTFSGGYRLKQDISECVKLIEERLIKPVEEVSSVTEEGDGKEPSNLSIYSMTDRERLEAQRQQMEARKQELIREISAMYSGDPRCEGKFAELNRIEAQLRMRGILIKELRETKMKTIKCTNCMTDLEEGVRVCPHCGYDWQADTQPAYALRKNTILEGHYLIGNAIGRGGFGITYVAFDLKLRMKVAVKEYYPSAAASRSIDSNRVRWDSGRADEYKKGRERFAAEARKMAALDAVPSIVRVRDVFEDNDTSYIVMDFVEGVTLKQYLLGNGVMDWDSCIRMLQPILESLAVMHDRGFIHRDISPDNIMVQPDGTARILDMGAAVDVRSTHGLASMAVAKKNFSAPEQYMESGILGSWTDVYSMAATLYYCLTGKVIPEAMERTFSGAPLRFPQEHSVPPYVAAALNHALELEADKRTRDMRMFRQQLETESETGLNDPHQAVGDIRQAKKGILPRRVRVIVACVGVLLAVCFIWMGISMSSPDTDSMSAQSSSVQKANTLMSDHISVSEEEEEYYVFGSGEWKREDITFVVFADSLEGEPEDSWDVSAAQDGSVKAWVDENCVLHIAADGGVILPGDSNSMFAYYANVTSMDLSGTDTSEVTDMSGMFWNCTNLVALDLSHFETANVSGMGSMFGGCSSLTELDLSSFDTSNVRQMEHLFWNCSALRELDVSGFDTLNVTSMYGMFDSCSGLTKLDVSGFDTSNVTDMEMMFSGCLNLTVLDVGNFDTSAVTNMFEMFNDCENLTVLDVGNFDTSAVTSMYAMFCDCENLANLDVSGFDTSNVTDMRFMFYYCTSLTELDVSGFDISHAATDDMFSGCDNANITE
ncbi:MAG: BspA family leucine-rich repeat surface protein [Lachnospiraceae bacterium]|nr:BspA family leucine-rich repeat surface protein [Lachnospiraceae bacterium]